MRRLSLMVRQGFLVSGICMAFSAGSGDYRASAQESILMGDEDYRFRVEIDDRNKVIQLYTLSSRSRIEGNPEVRLNNGTEWLDGVELRALPPGKSERHDTRLPVFAGSLDMDQSSYAGVELRFRIGGTGGSSGESRVVRWKR